MSLESELAKTTAVIVTHVYATGPAQKLEEYLRGKVQELVFIGHPFSFCSDTRSFYKLFNEEGRLIKEMVGLKFVRRPETLVYLKDALTTFAWVVRNGRSDIYIGANCLNAFIGLILKKLGRVKKVIFYTIDFIPQRFRNRILNRLYLWMDSFCVRRGDEVWNLSANMVFEREKRGVPSQYREKQKTVPVGTDMDVERVPFGAIDCYSIAFMGHLREGHGIEFLIDAMPAIVKRIPQAKLVIIGTGPLENQLKSQVVELNLDSRVELTGFIEDHKELQNRLARCAIAVAPYVDNERSYTRYTDPGKPKAYTAAGLPVVITKVPQVAREIEEAKCGFAINYDKKELAEVVIELLEDEDRLKELRENAIRFAEKFEWDKIFQSALEGVLERV